MKIRTIILALTLVLAFTVSSFARTAVQIDDLGLITGPTAYGRLTTLAQIIVAAAGNDITVIINRTITAVTQAVPSTLKLEFKGDGLITIAAGNIITFTSPAHIISPIDQQIFAYTVGVTPVRFAKGGKVHPEWWGAARNAITDDIIPINLAVIAACDTADNNGGTVYFSEGIYRTSSVITWDNTTLDTTNSGCVLEGAGQTGSAIFGLPGFSIVYPDNALIKMDGTGLSGYPKIIRGLFLAHASAASNLTTINLTNNIFEVRIEDTWFGSTGIGIFADYTVKTLKISKATTFDGIGDWSIEYEGWGLEIFDSYIVDGGFGTGTGGCITVGKNIAGIAPEEIRIENNTFVQCRTTINFFTVNNSHIIGNYIVNTNPIKQTLQHIALDASEGISILDNILRDSQGWTIYLNNTNKEIIFTGNQIIGGERGITSIGTNGFTFSHNIIKDIVKHGMEFIGAASTFGDISDNLLLDNGANGGANDHDGLHLDSAQYVNVKSNIINNSGQYGLYRDDQRINSIRNTIAGSGTADYFNDAGLSLSSDVHTGQGTPEGAQVAPLSSIYFDLNGGVAVSVYIKETGGITNTGWRALTMIQNSGSSSIDSGQTTKVVAHGLGTTPSAEHISIIGKEDPTNSVGTIWIDTIGAANFTVNVENDPGGSDWDFGWQVLID